MHLAVAFKTEGGLARCVAALDQRLQATGIEGHPVHAQQHVTGLQSGLAQQRHAGGGTQGVAGHLSVPLPGLEAGDCQRAHGGQVDAGRNTCVASEVTAAATGAELAITRAVAAAGCSTSTRCMPPPPRNSTWSVATRSSTHPGAMVSPARQAAWRSSPRPRIAEPPSPSTRVPNSFQVLPAPDPGAVAGTAPAKGSNRSDSAALATG